jgi:hypothetical protein
VLRCRDVKQECGRRACFVVVEGCATPIKIGGVFPGVQRQRMGWRARRARIVGRTLTGRRVLRCLCGRLCHHAVNCLAVDCVRARACTNKAWQTVVCSASGGAHKRQACSGVGGGGGGAGGVVVLKCSRTDGVNRRFGGRSSRRAASTRTYASQ